MFHSGLFGKLRKSGIMTLIPFNIAFKSIY